MPTLNEITNSLIFKSNEEKRKALEEILSKTQKKFGKESIKVLDGKIDLSIQGIPSDILSLDLALGGFGFPKGRIVEIYGPESSGKTTLCLNLIAQVQKMNGIAAFIDAEHAFSSSWAKKIGVNVNELLVSQPDCGEEALEIAENLIETNNVSLIVIDSVAALVPRAELEKDMGESSMGLQARLISQACRKLTGMINKSGTVVIFINQLRSNIGGYGNPEVTTGGNALKYYSSVRLDIRKKEQLKDGENVIGTKIKVKVVKNKIANPFTECTFDFYFDSGYDKVASVIEEAVKYEILKKGGAGWFTYENEKIQGLQGMKEFLKEKPELIETWKNQILEIVSKKGLSDEIEIKEKETKKRTSKEV